MARYRVIHPHGPLANLPEPVRQEWRKWLEAHGLDPYQVSVDCPMVCDDYANTLTVGIVPMDGPLIIQPTVLRLERPALPIPATGFIHESTNEPTTF